MKQIILSALLAAVVVCSVSGAEPVSRRDAARLQAKLDRISKNEGSRSKAAATTPITEAELNSYLRYELGDRIPPGVTEPWVSVLDNGRLSGKATVDLGRVGQSRKSGSMLDPFSLLTGELPLTVNGVLKTKNGMGTFAIESASLSGVPIPAWMLQDIVSYYSKSPTTPNGFSLDKPFALPSGIREIQLVKGQARRRSIRLVGVSTDYLQTPLQFLKGVGPKRAADLQRVGLSTIEDLLYRFPLRYEDRGNLQPISSLKPGQQVAISGRIQSSRLRTTRRPGFKIFEALIGDATGSIPAVWMNQAFLQDILRRDVHVVLFGTVEARPRLQVINPDYEVIDPGDGEAGDAGRRADGAHRPDCAGLRKSRRDDTEDAAPVDVRSDCAHARGPPGSVSRGCPATPSASGPSNGARRHAFPPLGIQHQIS